MVLIRRLWAYHITEDAAEVARRGLLLAQSRPRANAPGLPLLFFEETPQAAVKWAHQREFDALLRFPWPAGATDAHGDWTTAVSVPVGQVEVAVFDDDLDELLRGACDVHPDDYFDPAIDWPRVAWKPLP